MCKDMKCSMKLNGITARAFCMVNVGLVQQGCIISPRLFNLYISDLIKEIQECQQMKIFYKYTALHR